MKSAHVAPRAHGNGQLLLKATVHWVGTQALVGVASAGSGSTCVIPGSSWDGHGAHEMSQRSPTPAMVEERGFAWATTRSLSARRTAKSSTRKSEFNQSMCMICYTAGVCILVLWTCTHVLLMQSQGCQPWTLKYSQARTTRGEIAKRGSWSAKGKTPEDPGTPQGPRHFGPRRASGRLRP